MVHIGIDIGTSNTVVALANAGGEPEVRRIKDNALVPSLIAVAEQGGHVMAGVDAVDEWANSDQESVGIFRRWKLRMGEGEVLRTMRFGGAASTPMEITPEWLTTRLVEHVLSEVAGGVGGETVDSVLITVPHGWRRDSPEKCQATRQAAASAIVNGKKVEVQRTTVSEPVAAAVYWLWQAKHDGADLDFAGKHILVCDVGGGTLDLSLVRVGADDEPLTVVDAINNNYAGDFATALLMARAAKQYNNENGTSLPTDAEEILRQLGDEPIAQLRSWFVDLQTMQKEMSTRIAAALRRNQQPTQKKRVVLEDPHNGMSFSLTAAEFIETLEPFYAHGRELVRSFLSGHRGSAPYAVVFAGGGSRIHGVSGRIAGAALQDIYGGAADGAMRRIQINDNKIDQAIALGAALVASGTVKVEERLLCDIGLEGRLDESLAAELNAKAGVPMLLMPILRRGSKLPATFSSEDYKFDVAVKGGESLDFTIVIDDDPDEPWNQRWKVDVPSSTGHHQCSVDVSADPDGLLEVTLRYIDGFQTNIKGRLSRERSGRSKLLFRGQNPGGLAQEDRQRITPEQFVSAMTALRTGRRD